MKLRIPTWCRTCSLRVNGVTVETSAGADGYIALKRTWRPGDRVELDLKLEPRVIAGDHKNQGKAAVCFGPLVLAADEALLDETGGNLDHISLAGDKLAALEFKAQYAPEKERTWPGARVFRVNALTHEASDPLKSGKPMTLRLVPFADAGGTGGRYSVWLPLPPA